MPTSLVTLSVGLNAFALPATAGLRLVRTHYCCGRADIVYLKDHTAVNVPRDGLHCVMYGR